MSVSFTQPSTSKTYIITGPTSGFGLAAARLLAHHGTLILVGRTRTKLEAVQRELRSKGQTSIIVICDMSDIISVRKAVQEILSLNLPITGLLNNAGIRESEARKSPQGIDNSFATNHLGPLALTDGLLPYLQPGTNVFFVCSGVEDPNNTAASRAGFRGGRYISAEASARGEWEKPGSTRPGLDAYATSKQAGLATALALAREWPHIYINAVSPGFTPTTGLYSEDMPKVAGYVLNKVVAPVLPKILKEATTVDQAAEVITNGLLNKDNRTGVYLDKKGGSMRGSQLVHDTAFQDRVLRESRQLLAAI